MGKQNQEDKKHCFFSMVPFLIDDFGLDPYEHRIYCHLVRRAGENLEVAIGVRAIAEHCDIAKSTVEKVKRSLEDKHLIDVVKQGFDKPDVIRIVDLWDENKNKYLKGCTVTRTLNDANDSNLYRHTVQGCTATQDTKYINTVDIDTNVSTQSQAITCGASDTLFDLQAEQPSLPLKKPKPTKPKKEPKANVWPWIVLLAETFKVDPQLNAGRLGKQAKVLIDAGYTQDDVKWFAEKIWPKDWRAENGQKINGAILNAGILQAKTEREKASKPPEYKTYYYNDMVTGERKSVRELVR